MPGADRTAGDPKRLYRRSPTKVGLRVGGAESVFGRDGKRQWENYLRSTLRA